MHHICWFPPNLPPLIPILSHVPPLMTTPGILWQAEDIAAEMQRRGVGLDDYSVNALMTGYTRAKRPEDALRVSGGA